jgi:hypothetical protein
MNLSCVDSSAPLLASSTNFFLLFAEELPRQCLRALVLTIEECILKVWLFIHNNSSTMDTISLLKCKIRHIDAKVFSIYSRYEFNNFLISVTRNIPALSVARAQTDRTVAAASAIILEKLLGGSSEMAQAPTNFRFKTPWNGVCLAMVLTLAHRYLYERQMWTQAVSRYSKGADAEVSGYQSLYLAWCKRNRVPGSGLKVSSNVALELLCGICSSDCLLEGNEREHIAKISQLDPGLYKMVLSIDTTGHAVLFHRTDGNTVYVIDPNIGLMRCRSDQIQKLLHKLVEVYRPFPFGKDIDIQMFQLTVREPSTKDSC